MSADALAELYDAEMLSLLDKHCPVVKVRRKLSKLTPWFDADCRACRRRTRKYERRFRRTRSINDRVKWTKQLKVMQAMYEEKNRQYWRTKIRDSKGNSRQL